MITELVRSSRRVEGHALQSGGMEQSIAGRVVDSLPHLAC